MEQDRRRPTESGGGPLRHKAYAREKRNKNWDLNNEILVDIIESV
jgi:hypothetical protein